MTTNYVPRGPILSALRDKLWDESSGLCDRFNALDRDHPERAPLSARLREINAELRSLDTAAAGGSVPDPMNPDHWRVALEAHEARAAMRHATVKEITRDIGRLGVAASYGLATATDDERKQLLAHRDFLAESARLEDEIGDLLRKMVELTADDAWEGGSEVEAA